MDPVITGGAAITVTKVLVDGIKMAWPTAPSWAIVCLAFLLSLIDTMVVHVYQGGEVTLQAMAGNYLVAISVFAATVGITEVQKRADAMREKAKRIEQP